MKKDNILLQQRLRNDDKKALEEVYTLYKAMFVNYASRYNLTKESILDIYQDSVIAMYQNFVIKQTILENATIKTYLFGIGKHKILDAIKDQKVVQALPKEAIDTITEVTIEDVQPSQEQHLLAIHFNRMGKSCQEVLKLFYYRGFSIKEIVAHTHYKDENTVKSHKSRCLKKLTALIHNN